MAGVVFFFEPHDADVWSGRPVDLDAWALACLAAGDIDRVVVINRTEMELRPFVDRFAVVSSVPELEGRVARVVAPTDRHLVPRPVWWFDHEVDWYVFGPAAGWLSLGEQKADATAITIPLAHEGCALHAVHAASVVMAHRFAVVQGSR
jgi:hypothetical protein